MALAAPPVNERKRVKVYELKNNDWYDRGTGFCAGQMIGVSRHTLHTRAAYRCAHGAENCDRSLQKRG